MKNSWAWFLVALWGCADGASISPGMTLLQRLEQYGEEMGRLEQRPERWPDRQAMGEALKTQYRILIGRSTEFDRLVDLDVKRRELVLASRNPSLTPERAREIKEELVKIDKDREALSLPVKEQVQQAELRIPREQPQRFEAIAAIGLLSLGVDAFVSSAGSSRPAARSINVGGRYLVTDHGTFATVRTPQKQTYRCLMMFIEEGGVAIRCEPPAK